MKSKIKSWKWGDTVPLSSLLKPAAPDLLEAAYLAEEAILTGRTEDPKQRPELLRFIRAAIAKAEGKEVA